MTDNAIKINILRTMNQTDQDIIDEALRTGCVELAKIAKAAMDERNKLINELEANQ